MQQDELWIFNEGKRLTMKQQEGIKTQGPEKAAAMTTK